MQNPENTYKTKKPQKRNTKGYFRAKMTRANKITENVKQKKNINNAINIINHNALNQKQNKKRSEKKNIN